MLRIATAGSVDDGKSTLIGRLLYDSKAVMEDQLASVERTSKERGHDYTDLALVTDGLRAEREQGITIDVAYRYFATPKRKFIIADTPGHIQYTRNMVTGTSTAQLAIVLVDARHGLLEQSRRHAFLASLLGIRHIVLAVNKMDLIGWDRERFEKIRDDFHEFAARLDIHDVTTIPLSALIGDNVVTKSDKTPWYDGPALLSHLEEVYIAGDRNLVDVRFPVQYVIRPQTHRPPRPPQLCRHRCQWRDARRRRRRRAARRKDQSRITTIEGPSGPVDEAFPPMAVSISLADDIDISRGDTDRPAQQPAARGTGIRRHGVLDGRRSVAGARPRLPDQAHHPDHAGEGRRRWTTGSTSTRCIATRAQRRSNSMSSAVSRCAPRCRCCSTSTPATRPPARSS